MQIGSVPSAKVRLPSALKFEHLRPLGRYRVPYVIFEGIEFTDRSWLRGAAAGNGRSWYSCLKPVTKRFSPSSHEWHFRCHHGHKEYIGFQRHVCHMSDRTGNMIDIH